MHTSRPMPKLVSVSAARRSSNSFGIETVVALKMMLPHALAIATITNTRASSARGTRAGAAGFAAARATSKPRLAARKPNPIATHAAPGTKNAQRQPARSASAPARSAANASPVLP